LKRFCIPSFNSTDSEGTAKRNEDADNLINWKIVNTDKLITWMSDLATCADIIAASLGFSLAIVIIYLVLIKCCAGVLAYSAIVLTLFVLAGLGYVFQAKIAYYQSINDETYVLTMKVLCGLFYTLAGIWVIFILLMCNSIRLSIALIQAAARYVAIHPVLFFNPLIILILSVAFYVYWVALSVYIYTTGTLVKSSTFLASFEWADQSRYAWWYHLFALFWISAFITALDQFVIASCACIWYWEEGAPNKRGFIMSRSWWRAFRYHLGSLALGSFIIAVIRFIMVMIEYIKRQVDASGVKKSAGRCFNCLLSCCQCCLACLAKLMEFINKHAYIQVIKDVNNR
jgi:choline transporter-like protein 2/4/5